LDGSSCLVPAPLQRLIDEAMDPDHLYLQRLLDGELSAREASAMDEALLRSPERAAEHLAHTRLHQLLLAQRSALALQHHQALLTAITERLPAGRPAAYSQVRPLDILVAVSVFAVIGLGYGIIGTLMHGSLVLVGLAVISVVIGCCLVLMAGMLRRIETGFLNRLLRKPISIGPADALVYRAVGIAFAVGGIWLTHCT
jgi:hypothetical protein